MTRNQKIWLFLILLLAAYLRFAPNLTWDQGLLLHPDERFLTMVAEKVRLPDSFIQYWDSTKNPLSPYNNGYDYYVYGNLPLTLTRIAAEIVGLTSYDNVFLVGRALSGVADIATIFGVFLIGKLLYSTGAGLVAALLLTLAVQNIQLCRFMGTENFVGGFVVYCAVFLLIAHKRYKTNMSPIKTRWYVFLSAVSLGLGLACKISAIFFLPIALLSIGYVIAFSQKDYLTKKQLQAISLEAWVGICILFIAVTVIAFRIGQPSAFAGIGFLPSEQFLDNMKRIKEVTDGGEWPPNVQWAGRTPILFTIKNIFWYEMGPGLSLICLFGIIAALKQIFKLKNYTHLLVVSWVLFFLLYQSTRFVAYGRYLSIVYPFACVIGGWWIYNVYKANQKYILIPLILMTFYWAFAFHSIYYKTHSRIEASRWIYQNVPTGSVIGSEQWDDSLPLRVDGKDGFGGMFTEKSYNFYEVDTEKKRQEIVDYLDAVDYIAISSNRQFATIPRLINRFPFTSVYYEKLFAQELGFELVHKVIRTPSFMGIDYKTANAIESFTVYDHPAVYIFKKKESFNRNNIFNLLNDFPNGTFEKVTQATTKEVSWIY